VLPRIYAVRAAITLLSFALIPVNRIFSSSAQYNPWLAVVAVIDPLPNAKNTVAVASEDSLTYFVPIGIAADCDVLESVVMDTLPKNLS